MKMTLDELRMMAMYAAESSPLSREEVGAEFNRLVRLERAGAWENGWSAGFYDQDHLSSETVANPHAYEEVLL